MPFTKIFQRKFWHFAPSPASSSSTAYLRNFFNERVRNSNSRKFIPTKYKCYTVVIYIYIFGGFLSITGLVTMVTSSPHRITPGDHTIDGRYLLFVVKFTYNSFNRMVRDLSPPEATVVVLAKSPPVAPVEACRRRSQQRCSFSSSRWCRWRYWSSRLRRTVISRSTT